MKEQLKRAFSHEVGDMVYSTRGAGWLQEAARLDEVRTLVGTQADPILLKTASDVEKRRTLATHRLHDLQVRD